MKLHYITLSALLKLSSSARRQIKIITTVSVATFRYAGSQNESYTNILNCSIRIKLL